MKALKSLIFCLIVFLGVSSVVTAAPLSQLPRIFYVKSGVTGDCLSWVTACGLQTALAEANIGDQIWVAKGTYKSTTSTTRTATFQLKSGVAIYGGFPVAGGEWTQRNWAGNITTLSGNIGDSDVSTDNSYHVVTGNGVDATAVLDGFTISGGNANDISSHYDGGGMYNSSSSPTLTNIIFSTNSAYNSGGGMYTYSSSNPTLTNVTFSGNAAYAGGGMANNSSSPTLTNVTFSANPATVGGGMYNLSSNPTLINVTFSGNSAYLGGGIYNSYSSPVLNNVTFSGNSATNGGGMYNLTSSNPTLTNVTFSANPANSGGGVFNDSSEPTLTNVTFSNNTASNDGGGMSNNNQSHPTLTNVTFSNNTASFDGGGMANWNSNSTVRNAIFWGNTPALDQIKIDSNSSATITYSDIQGVVVYPGTGNINADPLLGPLANNGGFTQTHALLSGSPAIDKGDPNNCPTTDQRGYPRPIDGDENGSAICDMGAYEFGSSADGFTLTVGIVGSGAVTKSPDELKYPLSQVVNLTATANPGWTFSSWGGDASGTINPLPVTMSRHKSITANFTQDEYTLTVTQLGSGSVVVDLVKTTYHYGDLITLTPMPTTGWTFSGWSGDVTGTANPLTMNIQGNTSITATFIKDNFKIYLPLVLRN